DPGNRVGDGTRTGGTQVGEKVERPPHVTYGALVSFDLVRGAGEGAGEGGVGRCDLRQGLGRHALASRLERGPTRLGGYELQRGAGHLEQATRGGDYLLANAVAGYQADG